MKEGVRVKPQTIVKPDQILSEQLQNQKVIFSLYLVLFYIFWTLARLFWVLPGPETLSEGLLEAFVKGSIWILPVFMYLKILDRVHPIAYLKLNKKPKAVLWTVNAILITAVFLYIINHLLFGAEFQIVKGFPLWLNAVVLVGIIEEIVFRGFILQKFMKFMKFYKANVLTSLLFILIHVPIWIATAVPFSSMILISLEIFILSLILGYLFKRSGSLWGVIVLHSAHNLLVFLGF